MPQSSHFSRNVFINCPFDEDYNTLFSALIFTVYKCGFKPRCALEMDDATESRLEKILRIIDDCKYGIHDISRVELNENDLPRFNMPFELGLFYGCKRFGANLNKYKMALVLEREQYRYQQYISDIAGIDPKAHGNDVPNVIRIVRNWLMQASKRTTLPGHVRIRNSYSSFIDDLPDILSAAGLEDEGLLFNDLCLLIEEWINKNLE